MKNSPTQNTWMYWLPGKDRPEEALEFNFQVGEYVVRLCVADILGLEELPEDVRVWKVITYSERLDTRSPDFLWIEDRESNDELS